MRTEYRLCAALLPLVALAACAGRPVVDSGPRHGSNVPPELPADPVPRAEPKSAYGNGPIYQVYGQPYEVLPTSYGYTERGVASWYGRKFHGRPTSSQEPYDMHALTAAHKTLPLPTYVRVRNLANNRTVIVRVNDRGPFVDNRLIDLSYAAARRLDMVEAGVGLVEVTAISFDEPPAVAVPDQAEAPPPPQSAAVYVQVGAFGERDNAERRFRLLREHGIQDAFVYEETRNEQPFYRVRVGPIDGVAGYDALVASLRNIGIDDPHIVTE